MVFKKEQLKLIVIASVLGVFLFGLMIHEFSPAKMEPVKNLPIRPTVQDLPTIRAVTRSLQQVKTKDDDSIILQQLDRDREAQKQTKYLKTKLEQTNLELEQEKAFAQINKLKMENRAAFKESDTDGQKEIPEIKIEYIGGDNLKKEAILSIAGSNFQVKEKSSPIDNIQVTSISDSNVTVHFNSPQDLTKIIDFKPE